MVYALHFGRFYTFKIDSTAVAFIHHLFTTFFIIRVVLQRKSQRKKIWDDRNKNENEFAD